MRTSVSVTLFAAALCSSTLSTAAPPTYHVTEFGTDNGPSKFTTVNGINDLGDATVTVFSGSTNQAFLWQAGQLTPMDGLNGVCGPSPNTTGNGINDRGQVIVFLSSSDGKCLKSVLWQQGKVVRVIGPPPPSYAYVAAGLLNNFGQVTGTLWGVDSSVQTSFLWQNGKFTLLPGLPGSAPGGPGGTEAFAPNAFGVVPGTSGATDGLHAVLWRNGAVNDLGICPGYFNSYASSVNDLGEVVGACQMFTYIPIIWRNGQMSQLPMPATGPQNVIGGFINDFGQITGSQEPAGGDAEDAGAGLLWQGGAVYDLNTLIAANDPLKPYIKVLQAGVITNTGFILANGEDSRVPNNFSIQFILTPAH